MTAVPRERMAEAAPCPAAATAALSVIGVSHLYAQQPALVDVAFEVAPGRFTGLLGLNGAGKSTLIALITRLYGLQAGRIDVFGHTICLFTHLTLPTN